MSEATARAPATTGNAAVGFDVLGFAAGVIADLVTVRKTSARGVQISRCGYDIPLEAQRNTAGVALLAMMEAVDPGFGVEVEIDKQIPIGSGLGGSAASAVGAVVAANALLDAPRPHAELFDWALAGEAVASGHAHPDNVAPCLYGGLTLTTGHDVRRIPTPKLWVALVHPGLRIETKVAREILPREVALTDAVAQMGHLAAFVDACHRDDAAVAAAHCRDLLIEPHRKRLIPGFDAARDAAEAAGALAFSLSGSGPTVFALTATEAQATSVASVVAAVFTAAGHAATWWTCRFGTPGAELL